MKVWIVLDESPDAAELVLGVFDGRAKANAFFKTLDTVNHFETVALGCYTVNETFDGGRRYEG